MTARRRCYPLLLCLPALLLIGCFRTTDLANLEDTGQAEDTATSSRDVSADPDLRDVRGQSSEDADSGLGQDAATSSSEDSGAQTPVDAGNTSDPCDLCGSDEQCVNDVCEPIDSGCPCQSGSYCDATRDVCVTDCTSDADCADDLHCNTDTGQCEAQCPSGNCQLVCVAHDACPTAPGGGIVAGAQTPDRSSELQAMTAHSSHWPACEQGDELACHLFMREAVIEFHKDDPNWGLLTKGSGEFQCSFDGCHRNGCGYAADAIIYRATDQVVDVIVDIGGVGASVAWTLQSKRSSNNWAPPPGLCDGPVTPVVSNILDSGESLAAGDSRTSSDGRFELIYQSDGNLVLYHNSSSLWSSSTFGPPGEVVMQTDGNLVVYDASNQAQWSTGTSGNPGAYLHLQSDGNAVVYSDDGSTSLWNTGTCCL